MSWLSGHVACVPVVVRRASPLLLAFGLACGGDDGRRLAERSAHARETRAPSTTSAPAVATPALPARSAYYAVQLGSYADATAAARTARALTDSGWSPVVHRVVRGRSSEWRLYVALARDSVLPEFVAAGVRIAGAEALVVRDSFAARELAGVPVSYQALPLVREPSLTSTTRWMLSPDSTALLAVEDGAGPRGEARPDGVVFAHERLDCYAQLDSVWDVAPAPDWRRLAYGHVGPLPTDSVAGAPLADTRLPADTPALVGALPAGVSMGDPIPRSRPAMVVLPNRGRMWWGRDQPTLRRSVLPAPGGWRLAWARDGSEVLVGRRPNGARDNSPARDWSAVADTGGARILAAEDALRIVTPTWVSGPTLDPSLPVVLTKRSEPAARGRITSVGGWIRVTGKERRGRILGPGVLLAATRDGNFVLALAPQVNARRDAPTAQLVVYATGAGRREGPRACRVVDEPRGRR